MDSRISSWRDESGTVVRIEGRLDAATVPDLLATCRAVGTPLRLDLSGLMSTDAEGAEALRRLTCSDTQGEAPAPALPLVPLPPVAFGLSKDRRHEEQAAQHQRCAQPPGSRE